MKTVMFLLLILICSCGKNDDQMNLPDLSQVNKIELTYKTDFDSTGRIKLKSVDITEPKDISALLNTVSTKPFDYQYCISSGSMAFYKDTAKIIEMVFNTTPDFRHIAFNYHNKLVAIALSEENAKLLDSFKN